jgi:hypothetical protein
MVVRVCCFNTQLLQLSMSTYSALIERPFSARSAPVQRPFMRISVMSTTAMMPHMATAGVAAALQTNT